MTEQEEQQQKESFLQQFNDRLQQGYHETTGIVAPSLNIYIEENLSNKKEINGIISQCVASEYHGTAFMLYLGFMKIQKDLVSENLCEQMIQNLRCGLEQIFINRSMINDIISQKSLQEKIPGMKRYVLLVCNWTHSKALCQRWNRMSQNGDYAWEGTVIGWRVPSPELDDIPIYMCVINSPDGQLRQSGSIKTYIEKFPINKTILFQMEPFTSSDIQNSLWMRKNSSKISHVYSPKNGDEWHLNKTYLQLTTPDENAKICSKTPELSNIVSAVISAKYVEEGQITRVDFIRYMDTLSLLQGYPICHVFGSNEHDYKYYKGPLPEYEKDLALFPYRYTFNVESRFIPDYYSEKLIDGILAECLVFYYGCPNINQHVNPKAFVWLDLTNFVKSAQLIKEAIRDDWWSRYLPEIRKEKQRILQERQFFPRLHRILETIEDSQNDNIRG